MTFQMGDILMGRDQDSSFSLYVVLACNGANHDYGLIRSRQYPNNVGKVWRNHMWSAGKLYTGELTDEEQALAMKLMLLHTS